MGVVFGRRTTRSPYHSFNHALPATTSMDLVALRTTKISASDPREYAKIFTKVAPVIEPSYRAKHGRADRSLAKSCYLRTLSEPTSGVAEGC
jgi:hypothetical protein